MTIMSPLMFRHWSSDFFVLLARAEHAQNSHLTSTRLLVVKHELNESVRIRPEDHLLRAQKIAVSIQRPKDVLQRINKEFANLFSAALDLDLGTVRIRFDLYTSIQKDLGCC
jgi:hypothetical protein